MAKATKWGCMRVIELVAKQIATYFLYFSMILLAWLMGFELIELS
jgi:hypothetical protein